MAIKESDIAAARPSRRNADYAGNGNDIPGANNATAKMAVISERGQLRLVMEADYGFPPVSIFDDKWIVREVGNKLAGKHPGISRDSKILGGAPHLKGTRLSVAHVLSNLYHLGSIEKVAEKFSKILDAAKIKEALAYAHDFMEIACDLSEDDD
jgi:uncharacterized protein (DUF433 family)